MLFSINGSSPSSCQSIASALSSGCVVLFSSRFSTFVRFVFPARTGPASQEISIWNSLVSQSRSAVYQLLVEAPPMPAVVSVFPDTVEADSSTPVSVSLINMPASASPVFVRSRNGTFVANASLVSADDMVQVFQFSVPNSILSGNTFVLDSANFLEIVITATLISAEFSIHILSPSKPQIILPPRFTSLLITDAPIASFVMTNFGGLGGAGSVSASLSMNSVSQSLPVISYRSEGTHSLHHQSCLRLLVLMANLLEISLCIQSFPALLRFSILSSQ
jgi:hypothetical protein